MILVQVVGEVERAKGEGGANCKVLVLLIREIESPE